MLLLIQLNPRELIILLTQMPTHIPKPALVDQCYYILILTSKHGLIKDENNDSRRNIFSPPGSTLFLLKECHSGVF